MTNAQWTKALAAISLILSGQCGPVPPPMPCTPVAWNVAAGDWGEATNWDPMVVPGLQNCALIEQRDDLVTLNESAFVQELFLMNRARLQVVSDGMMSLQFTLDAADGAVNGGVIRAAQAGQLILTAPEIDQGQIGAGGIIEAVDGSPSGSPLSLVQIGNGADEVRLSGGTLQTDGVAAVIHLTTGVTISDVMIRQTPVAGGAPHSGVVIPDGHTASFENEIINDGVITIAASSSETRLLAAGNEPQVAGQGRIELTDENLAVLGETKGGGTCPPPAAQNLTVVGEAQVIEGEGLVSGPLENFGRIVANRLRKKLRLENSYYINRGELGAENGGIMVIRCARVDQSGSMNTPADPHGLIRAGQGSSVWIEQSTIGALTVPGNAVAAGGTISLNGVVAVFNMCTGNGIPPGPFGLFNVQSSHVTISMSLDVMGGEFHVLGSTLEAPTATVGLDARLTTDGGIMVDHVSTASSGINLMSLETGRGSTVKAVMLEILQPGEAHFSGRVELGGGFVFDNINPAEVDWAEGSELVFSPGSDATLEVGGTEFPLKTLRIEKGAEVTLQTMHHPPDSALFVGQIIIGPDATLDCNGISVFADSCSCADVSVPCSMVDGCFSCPPPPP